MYGSSYPHSLKITRAASGDGQDPETGLPIPSGALLVIYEGECDAQEFSTTGQTGLMMSEEQGTMQVTAELVIYVENEEPLPDVEISDTGVLEGRGSQEHIKVIAVKLLDGAIFANRI